MKNSITKNYVYNLIYQVYKIIIPIILTPYIARVLGEDGTGKYAFSYSIVTYFTLFANLGFASYAQRLIASHQGNKHKQSILFFEILISRIVPVTLSVIIYIFVVSNGIFDEKYRVLLLILTLEIVAIAFDISFFFQGNEEFGSLVIRNIFIRTISIAFIFLFVKDNTDLWKYTLIQGITILTSNLILWGYIPQKIEKVSLRELRPLKHLPGAFLLFLPNIAASVYTSLDKTLIGLIVKSDAEVGNYEYAEKLIKISMTVITALGTVLIPRNAKRFADGDLDGVKDNIYTSCEFVFFLGIPLMLGCISISDNLVPWFLGDGYNKVPTLMKILSPLIIIIGLSNVFGLQYLIPSNQDKKFTASIIMGAVTNLALNCVMITYWKSYGAAIATIIAETLVTAVMSYYIRKEINTLRVVLSSYRYVIAGGIMFIPCYILGKVWTPSILHSIIIIVVGIIIYIGILIAMKERFIQLAIGLIKREKRIGSIG